MIHLAQGENKRYCRLKFEPVLPFRRPAPAELGLVVTVCIVRRSWQGDCFVAASDRMLTFGGGWTSGDELGMKLLPLTDNWRVMYAGNDIGPAAGITAESGALLRLAENKRQGRVSADDVKQIVVHVYQQALRERIRQEVLGRYDLDVASYLQKGLSLSAPRNLHGLIKR